MAGEPGPLSRGRRLGRSRAATASSCGRGGPFATAAARIAHGRGGARIRTFTASSPARSAGPRAGSDWTCRALVGGPGAGAASTGTASPTRPARAAASAARSPRRALDDPRSVRFAFVSCQSVNEGAQNAYRRMIWEDRARAGGPAARLRAAPRRLHLRGGRVSRRGAASLRPHGLRHRPHSRRAQGRRISTCRPRSTAIAWSIARTSTTPTSRTPAPGFPFVCIGDNHEFSWQGWQSFIKYRRPDRAGAARCASPRTRRGGNTSRRACARRRAPASTPLTARPSRTPPITRFDRRRTGRRAEQPRGARQHDRAIARCASAATSS